MFGISWLTTKLAGYAAAALALLALVGKIFFMGKKSGTDAQKVKEAEAREKDLDAIKHASTVKPVSMSNDPNNRDNQNT